MDIDAPTRFTLMIPVGQAMYFVNIGLFWIYVLMAYSRINNSFARVVINFAQICSLIAYLPFRLD